MNIVWACLVNLDFLEENPLDPLCHCFRVSRDVRGRLTDFIDRGVITMANVGYLVLDEVPPRKTGKTDRNRKREPLGAIGSFEVLGLGWLDGSLDEWIFW